MISKTILTGCLVAALALTSCGGSDGVSETPATPSTPTAPSTPTTPATPEADQVVVEEFRATLADMSFAQLLDSALPVIELRDPESVVALTLEDDYGLVDIGLTPISFDYRLTTIAMWQALADKLNTIDRTILEDDEQLSFDILLWAATKQSELVDFIYFDYQATYFGTSVPRETELFFSELHPIANEQDINNYLTRLALVDDKLDQLIENLQLMEANGIIEPQITMQVAINVFSGVANGSINNSPYHSNFSSKVDALGDIDNGFKGEAKTSAQDIIVEQINPAYQRLITHLNSQLARAPTDIGVGQFENGDAYYQQRLGFHTTTQLSPQEIHDLGLQELQRIHAELRSRFDELGYPQNESLQQLFNRVATDGGVIPAADVVATYEALIDDAENRMTALFSRQPMVPVRVVGGPIGGFYVRASLDGARPGSFFASNVNDEPYFTMPTLAYHEAMPGHHMQIALAQETDLPLFRRNLSATGYVEGWGLYAERVAGDYGWYENDIYGDIGRLNFEALRAARLVVDTGIHAFGWSFQQASTFFQENVGVSQGSADANIARYMVYTGQATAYMVGMLKIVELRERMQAAQGDNFDIKAFHDLMLDNGAMPLTLLEQLVDQAIE